MRTQRRAIPRPRGYRSRRRQQGRSVRADPLTLPDALPCAGPVTIRKARPEDAAGIERLYRQLTADDPRIRVLPSRIDRITADPATLLLVAERSGRLVGTTLLTVCLDAMYGEQPYLVVENVVVDDVARGAGVGRRLLNEVDRLALETNATKVMLLSSKSRPDAHRFFEVCGYSSTAKRGFVRYRSDID